MWKVKLLLLPVALGVVRPADCAQKAPTPFSSYGQIQNVQNYSSNPFWTKDSPYNQRMPTPIYATGSDLNTGDCNRVVGNLIASFCASNNCSNKKISDVRPTIMVQLSQLPGHNFATSCGGYIDSEFDKYKKTYGNVSTNKAINTVSTTKTTTNSVQVGNLFPKQVSEYDQGVAERTTELARLQALSNPTPKVTAAEFPKTIADLSFTDRMAINAAGYEPYKDLKSYKTPDFEEEDEEFFERLKTVNFTEYCRRRPGDSDCKPTPTTTTSSGGSNSGGSSSSGTDASGGNTGQNTEVQNNCANPGSTADCPIILNLN